MSPSSRTNDLVDGSAGPQQGGLVGAQDGLAGGVQQLPLPCSSQAAGSRIDVALARGYAAPACAALPVDRACATFSPGPPLISSEASGFLVGLRRSRAEASLSMRALSSALAARPRLSGATASSSCRCGREVREGLRASSFCTLSTWRMV